jgi:protein O-GlcNAc transferase
LSAADRWLELEPKSALAVHTATKPRIRVFAMQPAPIQINYLGYTATFEALWMGVPSITLVGDSHRSRVSGSILSRLNLGEFIAHNETEYLDVCKHWSNEIAELAELRTNMRQRLRTSKMMDAEKFTKNLEDALKALIEPTT